MITSQTLDQLNAAEDDIPEDSLEALKAKRLAELKAQAVRHLLTSKPGRPFARLTNLVCVPGDLICTGAKQVR